MVAGKGKDIKVFCLVERRIRMTKGKKRKRSTRTKTRTKKKTKRNMVVARSPFMKKLFHFWRRRQLNLCENNWRNGWRGRKN